MTALFIILAIAVLICLLLLCPITVKATYREEFAVVVSYLFFRFRFPGPESDESQMEASEAEEEKTEDSGIFGKYKEMLKRKGLSGLLSLLSEITRALKKASKRLLRAVVVRELSLQLFVVGEDAADTALRYGKTCAVVYPAVSAILHAFRYHHYTLEVQPDFSGGETRIDGRAVLRIRAFSALSIALGLAVDALKILNKLRQDRAGSLPGASASK